MINSFTFFNKIISFLLFFNILLIAQEEHFIVTGVKGSCYLLQNINNSLNEKKLRTTDTVKINSLIKVSKNSYISIVHSFGGFVEIKKDGIYNVDSLNNKLKTSNNASIFSKFFDYFMKNFKNIYNDVSKSAQFAGGYVNRSTAKQIILFSPEFSYTIPDTIEFNWEKTELEKYNFNLFDENKNLIFSKSTTDTFYLLDIKNLISEKTYFWNISGKNSYEINFESKTCSLIVLNSKKAEEIKNEYNKIFATEYNNSNITAGYFLKGLFFEYNELNFNALKNFKMAFDLEPDVQSYKNMYKYFLNKVANQL